jgi:hypothetical protein
LTAEDRNAKLLAKNVRAFDIETENTGFDIHLDNKRIISVQIGNASNVEVYYADSKDPALSLLSAKRRLTEMLSNGYVLTGYGVEDFDNENLKKFLDFQIPPSNLLDLSQTDFIKSLKHSHRLYRLEDICSHLNISVRHKDRMITKAESYKTRFSALADIEAIKIAAKKGGTVEYAKAEAMRKVTIGNAIYDSYKEFLIKDGSKDTLFYEYAVGDVICEYLLFEIVKQKTTRV